MTLNERGNKPRFIVGISLYHKSDYSIHSYVLMTNHVHLILTQKHAHSAGLLMKLLGQRYVQYINRTYKRCKNLWKGRLPSSIIQQEEYLFRYELEPTKIANRRNATNGNYALVSNRFKDEVSQATGHRTSPRKAGRPKTRKPAGETESKALFRILRTQKKGKSTTFTTKQKHPINW